jgi:hypothetical protein
MVTCHGARASHQAVQHKLGTNGLLLQQLQEAAPQIRGYAEVQQASCVRRPPRLAQHGLQIAYSGMVCSERLRPSFCRPMEVCPCAVRLMITTAYCTAGVSTL